MIFVRFTSFIRRLLFQQTIATLVLFFISGIVFSLVFIYCQQSSLVEQTALINARQYSQAIAEFRTIYTEKVVTRIRSHGVIVSHDYENYENSIPLPATLSMELGKRIGKHHEGAETRLYSGYPFPWRGQVGKFKDSFSKQAWEHLSANPDKPYYKFETCEWSAVPAVCNGGSDAPILHQLS